MLIALTFVSGIFFVFTIFKIIKDIERIEQYKKATAKRKARLAVVEKRRMDEVRIKYPFSTCIIDLFFDLINPTKTKL